MSATKAGHHQFSSNGGSKKTMHNSAISASSTSAKKQNRAFYKHKKDDDEIDEEAGGSSADFMTEKYRKDNDKKLDALADSVTQIKNLSKNIGNQMEEEKTTIGQLDGGF